MKRCVLCEHFSIDFGFQRYSEWTPGSPGSYSCDKLIFQWNIAPSESDFYRDIREAETCELYKQREYE